MLLVALVLLWLRAASPTSATSALQGGAVWPMAGRNQYHTSHSVFGIESSGVSSVAKGVVSWSLSVCSSTISASPVISRDGTVYVGCSDGYMYAVTSAKPPLLRWKFQTGGGILRAAALGDNNILYFGSLDSNLYAVEASNGTLVWSRKLSNSIRSAPVLGYDRTVYVGVTDGTVYSVSASGSVRWTFNTQTESQVIQGDLAYYGDTSTAYLVFLSHAFSTGGKTGEHLIEIKTSDGTLAKVIYNINPSGTLAISSPSIDISLNLGRCYIGNQKIQGFRVFQLDPLNALDVNPRCCGSSSVTQCAGTNDIYHTCQVMGSIYATPSINMNSGSALLNHMVFWGTTGSNSQTVGDSTGKDLLFAYNTVGGNLASAYPTGSPVQAAVAIDKNDFVYAVTTGGSLMALTYAATPPSPTPTPPLTVTQKWTLSLCPTIYASPVINSDGTIVVACGNGMLYAVGNADSSSSLISAPTCATPGTGIDSSLKAYSTPVNYPALSCSACAAGTFSRGTVCAPCSPGGYTSLSSQTSCQSCSAGSYSSAFGATACGACGVGSSISSTGASVCTPCSTGYYGPSTGLTACSPCLPGYSSSSGASSCSPCVAGKFASASGQAACSMCANGFFSVDGATACTGCPFGTSSSADKASCIPCPLGTYSDKTGSVCLSCPLGFIHTPDRRTCRACSWPLSTSVSGNPSCNSFLLVPYQLDDDWSTAAVISYAVIIAVSAFPFFWAVVGAEVTSDEDTHFSGNIVTKLGVAGLLFSPNLCLVSTTLFVLTSNFLHPAIFAFMLLSLVVAPLIGFVLLVREINAIPWGSMDDAAAKKGPIERTKVWCKLFFATGPWMLVGLAFYVSRALVVKAVWNHWFRVYTGLTYQIAFDKINCRFWNRVTSTALALQYFPQLVLVCIAQTFQVSVLGIVTIVLLALNCVLCAQHLVQHRLQLDAVVELNLRAADVMLLHFDPRSLDFHDDAPVEQNMVRGTVIFDGEGIELATGVEVLRAAEIVQGRITTVSSFCRASLPHCPPSLTSSFALHTISFFPTQARSAEPGLLNLGGFLTFTHELIFSPEELPHANLLHLGRATRIYEGVPVPLQGNNNSGPGVISSQQYSMVRRNETFL